MNKIIVSVLLGFVPFIANCASSQHVLMADKKSLKDNEYVQNFAYSEKNEDGYVGLALWPNGRGLLGMVVFNAMAYEDRKKLFELYKTTDERIIQGPRKKAVILLNDKPFVDMSVSGNIRHVSLDFPYIAKDIKVIETIESLQNDMSITLDPKINYTTGKDTRKNRLDWLNTDMFTKNNDHSYSDQAHLVLTKRDTNSLGIRGGCLSSELKGKIKNVAVLMTEVGDTAKKVNFKVIDIDYSDPVFQTNFISEVNIKLRKSSLVPVYKKHVFKLVCTTLQGIQFTANDTYISNIKPRNHEY